MKRFVRFLVLILAISLSILFLPTAYAEETGTSAYDYMSQFVTQYKARGEKTDCTEYISAKFEAFGLDKIFEGSYTSDFSFVYSTFTLYSQNVAAIKKSENSNGTVIIGAGYDNLAGWSSSVTAEGAYSNGTGIGVLLALAEYLSTKDYGYDIVFVAFGAEQLGSCGSQYFVSQMSAEQIDNTLLYVNLNKIGAGDKLYMYFDEVEREHGKLFSDVAAELEIDINSAPDDKKLMLINSNVSGLPYIHAMQNDALRVFYGQGINCAGFMSFNWDLEFVSYYQESANYANIADTNEDTLVNLNAMYGDSVKDKMDSVVHLVSATLANDGFADTMRASADNPPKANDTLWIVLSAVLTSGLLAWGIYAFVIYRKTPPPPKHKNFTGANGSGSDKKDEKVFEEYGI